MKRVSRNPVSLSNLRQEAESRLRNSGKAKSVPKSESEILMLVQELQVHQVELELQNEQLIQAIAEAKDATELYDFAPIGYFTLSRKGEIIRTNYSGAALLGNESLELKNNRFDAFVSDYTKSTFQFFLERVFKTGTKQSCEVSLAAPGKPLIYIQISGIVTENEQFCLLTATDISERKRAEKKMQALNTRLELAMQLANMAWWEMDFVTGAVTFDPQKTDMLGYAPEKFKHYRDFMALVHPDDYEKVMKAMRAHFDGTIEKYEAEYRILTKSGNYIWLYDIGSVVKRDSKGIPLTVSGLVINVTDRKRAEEEIRIAHSRLRRFVDSDVIGVVIAEANGGIIECNDYFLNCIGYSRTDLENGKVDWRAITPAEWLMADEVAINELRKKGKCNPYEKEYIRKDGNRVPVIIADTLLPGPNEQIAGFILDITDRKKTEVALIQSEALIRKKLKAILDPESNIGDLQLSDFLDTQELQTMMEEFYRITHIGIGILDLKGQVLIGVGWQDICTKFHRVNPETLKNCLESDIKLSAGVTKGESKAYRCKNNLWDIMTPIEIGGKHIGNVCLGQFFYDDEVPDYELFKKQAGQYGFDEQEYMAALQRVPRFTRETVNATMTFYAKLAGIISSLSYSTLKLSRAFSQEEILAKQLKESELKYRTVADFTYDWEAWRTPDGTNCYVSPSCERITGHPAAEFLANPQLIIQITHPDDRPLVIEQYSKALHSTMLQPIHFDFRIINKDGIIHWISHLSTAVYGENGAWLGRRESNRDITDRMQAIRALEENETRFKNLFELHSAIMLLVDPYSKEIVEANHAAAKFYGYSISALKSMKIDEINVLPEDMVKSERERIRQNNQDYFIFRHRLATGQDRIVEVHSTPIDFQEKQVLFLIIHDITERMLYEREIQLKNEQLVKINAEKDKFFSILAHDLRGPFNGFLGLTQIMSEKLQELTMDEVQKIAFSMKNSATNLFRLLENLLHWARFEQGLMPFDPKVVNLQAVVNENIVILVESALKKGIEIECLVPENIKVIADINMLQTIIRNLVSNAVKFTPKGGKINISAKYGGIKSVEITIRDTGIGMNQAMLDNLFTVDVKTNRKGTDGELSTGLGLILCKEFVEKHGGEIRVKSKEGKGSVFIVAFPAATD